MNFFQLLVQLFLNLFRWLLSWWGVAVLIVLCGLAVGCFLAVQSRGLGYTNTPDQVQTDKQTNGETDKQSEKQTDK